MVCDHSAAPLVVVDYLRGELAGGMILPKISALEGVGV